MTPVPKPGSLCLDNRGRKLGAKDLVPEPAGDTKAVLVVEEVVLEVVLLELLVPKREVLVVEKVMRQVVADIAKDSATVHRRREVPVPVKEHVGELPERRGKGDEQRRRHHKTIFVHGEVVVNAMEQKVGSEADPVVR